MPEFSEICNEKFETRGDMGVRTFDRLVREKVGEALHNDDIVDVEDIDDIVADVLQIADDDTAELAKARVRLVIARMLERMTPAEREHAMWFIVGDIPGYDEARKRFSELNR